MTEDLSALFDRVYASLVRAGDSPSGPDDVHRHPEYTGWLLAALGRPDKRLRAVVVTGSKGKGSTSYYLSRILRAHGVRVGLYTGPHLLDSRERFRVDDAPVPPAALWRAWDRVRPPLERLVESLPPGRYVSPVGIMAVLAAEAFAAEGVEVGIFETGRGARVDDVNRLHHELGCITRLLPEHRRELGPGLARIAWHKAGVLQPETRALFLADPHPLLQAAVRARAVELGTSPDVRLTLREAVAEKVVPTPAGVRFCLSFPPGSPLREAVGQEGWGDMFLPSLGAVAHSAAVAVVLAGHILPRLEEARVRDALAGARWPGRGEVLSLRPHVVLDAAIRREPASALLAQLPPPGVCVLSIPQGKDLEGVAAAAEARCARILYTGCSNPRLAYDYRGFPRRPQDRVVPEVIAALEEAYRLAREEDTVVLLGTLSFVGDVYRWLGRSP